MPRRGYKSIVVKEDTYELFQKFRGKLFIEKGRRVTEDETLKILLTTAMKEVYVSND
uniref:Uncharacterized protein n=1 Tax=Pyrococcus abyssi TaxID=29292 RepID=A0A5J6XVN1_PYRAY|nr:hypothetical protein [Pyrococcus abyssi]QFN51316.1 hypothetical protein [Pyrococcus abyssi]